MEIKPILLPVMDVIKDSWDKINGTKASFWAAFGITILVAMAFAALQGMLAKVPIGVAVIMAISLIINILLQTGLIFLGIKRALNLPMNYRDMFVTLDFTVGFHLILYLCLQFVIDIAAFIPVLIIMFTISGGSAITMSFIGILLFGIAYLAVIYIAVRLMLAPGYILHLKYGAIQAMKASLAATKGNFWRLSWLGLLSVLIILVSSLPLGIGLIWTIPMAYIIYGETYRRLALTADSLQVPPMTATAP